MMANSRVTINIFTDPMMGLSYESEPFLRKLETHYPDHLHFEYKMSLLVRDVRDFMNQEELSLPFDQGIARYNQRLAQIYKSEEHISSLPINMNGFHLFSTENTSSLPLNLAYLAVKRIAPDLAEQFLYRLRYATIAECRPTTQLDELCDVAAKLSINLDSFKRLLKSDLVKSDLMQSLQQRRSLGIRGLPAYLLEYEGRKSLVSGVADFSLLSNAIQQITEHKLPLSAVRQDLQALQALLAKHPLISPVEIREALDLPSLDSVEALLHPMIESRECEIRHVPGGWFIEWGGVCRQA